MKYDPYTLRVALDKDGSAHGELYVDDGETFAHEKGEFVWRALEASTEGKSVRIKSRDLASQNPSSAVDGVSLATYDPKNSFARNVAEVRVEEIVVLGLKGKPSKVKNGKAELEWDWYPGVSADEGVDGAPSQLFVKNPVGSVVSDWEVSIEL